MGLVGLLVVPGVGFVCLFVGLARHRPALRRRGAALVLAAVFAFALSAYVSRRQEQASRERGDLLAIALDGYRAGHGDYPERLEELVPTFVPHVPTTCMGLFGERPFVYDRWLKDYRLGFSTTLWNMWERGPDGALRCGD